MLTAEEAAVQALVCVTGVSPITHGLLLTLELAAVPTPEAVAAVAAVAEDQISPLT